MQVTVFPGVARGSVEVPASKSVAHRLLLGAGLAEGESLIHRVPECTDVDATLSCLTALGVETRRDGDTVTVHGGNWHSLSPLPCGESGSTLRFFLPSLLRSGEEACLRAAPSLMRRPMGVYESLCLEKGLLFRREQDGYTVRGPLLPGVYEIPGDVSSQFITGLLFALPLLDGDSVIRLTTAAESRPYIGMTADVLERFGVAVQWLSEREIAVPGGQRFSPAEQTVEGDYSAAAPLMAMNALGGSVTLLGLPEETCQGDAVCREYINALETGYPVIDLADCPDLGPVLMALAAMKHGGIFTGIRRLRLKESDRVEAMREELAKLGCSLQIGQDSLTVPAAPLHPPVLPLSAHGDHRIVMACALLLTKTGGMLTGAEAVAKSFPGFFDILSRLGISISK